MFDPLALARRLIDIPSPTEQEREVGAFLRDELTRLGYNTRTQDVTAGRFNLFAAAGGRPRVVLNSHIDTVPPWFAASEDDDFLYGRGACDTKAFIAAALTAIERIDLAKLTKPLALIFTADEEIGCLGAKHLAEARPFKARYAIVGEPTSLQPIRAGKGYCFAEFTLRGREGLKLKAVPLQGKKLGLDIGLLRLSDSAANSAVAAFTSLAKATVPKLIAK